MSGNKVTFYRLIFQSFNRKEKKRADRNHNNKQSVGDQEEKGDTQA